MVRWLVLSLLVLKLGPSAVPLMGAVIRDHLPAFLGGPCAGVHGDRGLGGAEAAQAG
jgi:hypothetical protein